MKVNYSNLSPITFSIILIQKLYGEYFTNLQISQNAQYKICILTNKYILPKYYKIVVPVPQSNVNIIYMTVIKLLSKK